MLIGDIGLAKVLRVALPRPRAMYSRLYVSPLAIGCQPVDAFCGHSQDPSRCGYRSGRVGYDEALHGRHRFGQLRNRTPIEEDLSRSGVLIAIGITIHNIPERVAVEPDICMSLLSGFSLPGNLAP